MLLRKVSEALEKIRTQPHKAAIITKLFKNFLKQNPYDTEIWIKFSLILHCFFKDYHGALECLHTVLRYNPDNINVIMLFTFISEHIQPMPHDVFEKLCELTTPCKELLSLIEYQKSWYYLQKNESLYHYTLENSVELCDGFVWNQKALGSFYFLHDQVEHGRLLFKKALKNIHHVYSFQEYQFLGSNNIDEFFNAHLKGTHIMQPVVLMMIDVLDSNAIKATAEQYNPQY